MYGVLYRWKIKPGFEDQFLHAWEVGTRAIAREHGGLGSRMHRGQDGCFYAYAQWPDQATFDKAFAQRMHHSEHEAARLYHDAIEEDGFEVIFHGEVLSDLLKDG